MTNYVFQLITQFNFSCFAEAKSTNILGSALCNDSLLIDGNLPLVEHHK